MTVDMSADDVHELGLQEVDRIALLMEGVGLNNSNCTDKKFICKIIFTKPVAVTITA